MTVRSEDETNGGVHHEVTARAVVSHYKTYDSADDIPVDQGRQPSLVEFSHEHMDHLAYRCECGQAFLKPEKAAKHLAGVDNDE